MRRADLVLLARPDLRRFVISRTVTTLGTAAAPVALAFGILALPGGSAGEIGAVLTASAVGQLVGVLIGGVAADRFGPVRVMVASEGISGIATLVTAWMLASGSLSLAGLVATAAVSGVAGAMFFPASTALLPGVVDADDLQSANGLVRIAANLARIVGAAAGGGLVAAVGAPTVLVIDAATFVVSVSLLLRMRLARPVRVDGTSPVRDLRDGWSAFTAHRWLVIVVASFLVANIGFGAALGVLGPVRAEQSLGGAAAWGLLASALAVGTVVGVVVAVRIRPARPLVVACLAISPQVALVAALAWPAPLWVLLVLALLSGVGIDLFEVLWQTAMQQHVAPELLGRVASYDWLGSLVAVPVGLALAGPVEVAIGLPGALLCCAAFVAAPVLAAAAPSVHGLRAVAPTEPS